MAHWKLPSLPKAMLQGKIRINITINDLMFMASFSPHNRFS
jgi:hypothetical protein